MSDLKDSRASGQSAAAGGLSRKPESTPSASPALGPAPSQGGGYLSKLFGFGSGIGPSAVDRPNGAMDDAHDYHPELAFSPTDVGIWETHSGGGLQRHSSVCNQPLASQRAWSGVIRIFD
ncbi:TPA: hypothetical protein ACH3X3_005252 [Trebouxia sp. C0006]